MNELHWPWLLLAAAIPLCGAVWLRRSKHPDVARTRAMWFGAASLGCTLAAWVDFAAQGATACADPVDPFRALVGRPVLVMDELSAPLLVLTALLAVLISATTQRTKIRRFSFGGALVTQAILLAMFATREPWAIITLLALGALPPYAELRARNRPVRVYVWHMLLFVALLIVGGVFVPWEGTGGAHSLPAVLPLLIAICIRSGIAPFHCWMTDLFEHGAFGTALLFVLPIPGAYAAVRLLLPAAPDWVLTSIGIVALGTALYASGMALVQRDARRFCCYLFLSHSALVFVGLDAVTPIGLTGALCVWLSVSLGLGGLGLVLRAVEARHGRLALDAFHGQYEHAPVLAALFLLTGLASVGFPGTFGFVGAELLLHGAVQAFPYVGLTIVFAAMLNGIAIVTVYFALFTGARRPSSIPLSMLPRERIAVLVLALIILAGGVFPQPGVASRNQAAMQLLEARQTQRHPSGGDGETSPAAVAPSVGGLSEAAYAPNTLSTGGR